MGGMVTFPANGSSTQGYLASPASGKGPGVVVIQEWWGLNDQVKSVADMLAREGFNALAPDLYHGKGAKIGEPDAAKKLMMEFFQANTAAKDARGAALFLATHPVTSSAKIGAIGFCMGGFVALLTAAVAEGKVGAVVDCYGVGQSLPDLMKLKGVAVMGIFGGKDHSIDAAAIAKLEAGLRDAGVALVTHLYPEADHAFMNEQRKDAYRPDDAKDAWSKAIAFLKQHVR